MAKGTLARTQLRTCNRLTNGSIVPLSLFRILAPHLSLSPTDVSLLLPFLFLVASLSLSFLCHPPRTREQILRGCSSVSLYLSGRACGSVPACDIRASSSSPSPSSKKKCPARCCLGLPYLIPFLLGPLLKPLPSVFSLSLSSLAAVNCSRPPSRRTHSRTVTPPHVFFFCLLFFPTFLFSLRAPSRDCSRWQEVPRLVPSLSPTSLSLFHSSFLWVDLWRRGARTLYI